MELIIAVLLSGASLIAGSALGEGGKQFYHSLIEKLGPGRGGRAAGA